MNSFVFDAQKAGLKIVTSKTKEIRTNTISLENLHIEEQLVKRANKVCYLGSMMIQDEVADKDINSRIRKAH